jgi:DNA-binding CsgD family transcriptional regulator
VSEIQPGAHVCALYSGAEERDRLLVPFLQEGLRHGDQCVCLIDDVEPVRMRQRAYGPAAPGDTRRPGRLGVYRAPGARGRAGERTAEQMIALLVADLSSSVAESPLLRVAGEMSPVPHEPGTTELSAYESGVSRVLAELPALFLCMYDVQRCRVEVLVDVLRIHSTVLLDGSVLHNSHCLDPADYPKPAPAEAPRHPLTRLHAGGADGGERWLTLTGAEVRLAGLVARGLTNRASAAELFVSPHTVDAHLKHIYLKLGIHSRVELTVFALRHGRPAA